MGVSSDRGLRGLEDGRTFWAGTPVRCQPPGGSWPNFVDEFGSPGSPIQRLDHVRDRIVRVVAPRV
jgi:hypothetical protein